MLFKVGGSVLALLLGANIYFVKRLVDSVDEIPSMKEKLVQFERTMPNYTELRVEVAVLKYEIKDLREEIKRIKK
jgi:hypothetical protein